MNKKKAKLARISLLLMGIFFLSCSYMNISANLEIGNVLRKAVIVADDHGMEVFQQQLSDGRLKTAGITNTVKIKHSVCTSAEKGFVPLAQVTYLTTILLINGVLCREGKGRVFVCFVTFVFHKARFLCELFVGKKKDGKKWIPAFL